MLTPQTGQAYTDFNALAKLKNDARNKTPDSIKEVAKQFESVFVGMMLKSMRQAKLADGIMDSNQGNFYRDMYDQQLSVHLAGEHGIGLAKLIAKQLSPNQPAFASKNLSIEDYERKLFLKTDLDNSGLNTTKPEIKSAEPYQHITSAENFINYLRPHAQQAAKKLGIDANLLLSQAALETGWGKAIIKSAEGSSSYNLFNIKADSAWQGQRENKITLEYRDGTAIKENASFRAYDSYQQSFDDYVDFIKTNPRYQEALKVSNRPERYIYELQQAGYATDPDYAKKVMKIFHSKHLADGDDAVLAMKQTLNTGL